MSTQTIPLPIKPKQKVEQVTIITNADKQKLKQTKRGKVNQTQKLYKQIKQNLPDVIGILKGMGYVVSEANQK
jgi:hypothetical protein